VGSLRVAIRQPRQPDNSARHSKDKDITMNQVETGKPVCIDHEDLIAGDVKTLLPGLREAFGDEPDCLGIVLVDMKSVPEYSTLRKVLLSYSSYLAALPPEQLTALENVHSKYVVGWSHGKEKLKSGAADIRKGTAVARA
jgi:hypothetical protein